MPNEVNITFHPQSKKASAHPDPVKVHKNPNNVDKFDHIEFKCNQHEFRIRFKDSGQFENTPDSLLGGPGQIAVTGPIKQNIPDDDYKYYIDHLASGKVTDPDYRVRP